MPETPEGLFALQGERGLAVKPSVEVGLVHGQKPGEERVFKSRLLAEPLDLAPEGCLGILLKKIGDRLELHDPLHRTASFKDRPTARRCQPTSLAAVNPTPWGYSPYEEGRR